MSDRSYEDGGPRRGAPGDRDASSAERLERAIEELKHSASDVVNERAAGVVEELERSVRRLRRQLDAEAEAEERAQGPEAEPSGVRRPGRAHRRSRGMLDPDEWFSRQEADAAGEEPRRSNGWLRDLYREPERGWIAGVCAGVARYYDVDVWVARVVAFSLLIFVPQIAFWAYVIAIFMLAKRPRMDAPTPARGRPSGRTSPASEFGPRFAPPPGLRSLRLRFRDLEQRLRRMEETVTSQEFTLKRELSALEAEERRPGGVA